MEFEKNIKNTAERISDFINHTPLQYSPYLSKIIDGNVYLKLENTQKTGSFKFRGAMSKISAIAKSKNPKKVITASTGNHGAACSLAMSLKGVDGSIYVPKNAHQNKIDKIKQITHNWESQLKKIILLIEESLNIDAPVIDKNLPARWYDPVDHDSVLDRRHARLKVKGIE